MEMAKERKEERTKKKSKNGKVTRVMHSHEVETLVTCAKAHADMPEKVLNHWNDQIAMFTGMSDAEVVLLVCKTSLDAGEALYEEFSNTHPEHKKTIDTIAAQCYEKATGQKTA
ncbi:uncharacterized protein LOC142582612 isoform X5 [Dermacentor variabilis]|uniref:uncharacterized protein LOC142582612 isoform X5 n=1 Tax=Dermacentor variabilis TaxID=34621 RepID=UPI003F5C138D